MRKVPIHGKDAIEMKMMKIREAFELYEDNISDLSGYQEITTHFLGENFRRKARLVADGHKTETPKIALL